MATLKRILLINPTITSRRSARFPLSLLSVAGSIQNLCTSRLIDGNVDRDYLQTTRKALREESFDAVGITVMGGPQVRSAVDTSLIVREVSPGTPIIWGGYFPTLYTDAAMNAPYVDYAVRGQGESTFAELLQALGLGAAPALEKIKGLSWKRDGQIVHNSDRAFLDSRSAELLPYDLLADPRAYLAKTFIGRRTVLHQASVGCRFRCTFCGVAAMFRGSTRLPAAARLQRDLEWLVEKLGADSVQYVDHNFFDREADMIPLLEVMAKVQLPWWCYARADALLNLSASSWALVRQSRMRMAYIGAESPSDAMLKSIRKGTTADQTLAVAELCRSQGVIPELSFMVAPPHDPVGETERTFEFIREVKKVNPQAEIIIYIYTPLPGTSLPLDSRARRSAIPLLNNDGSPLLFPVNPEGWTEKKWVDYSCHADAPWLTDRLRARIRNFVTVLGCRYPTLQDARAAPWSKLALRGLATWRYRYRQYDSPWELALAKRLIRIADPQTTGI
jgi:anaerobic magnesium-protoporphyrin IX monomethyl ester cyclase